MPNKVILAYSSNDGVDLANKTKDLLAGEPLDVSEDINKPIDIWDAVVVLFVLTPAAFQDAQLKEFVKKVSVRNLPLVPVVADLDERLSAQLPPEIKFLEESNIVELRPDRKGPKLAQTVAGYLGLESFAKDQKVFISYRRTDTQNQVNELSDYLWLNKFATFLDTEQIEGGTVVQKRIVEQVSDKDLVLLFDSPNINSSDWVKEEIITAITHRVPICVLKLNDEIQMPLVKDVPQIKWDATDGRNLEKIKLMISRRISSRESFDNRIKRTLQDISSLKQLTLNELERRRYIISRGRKKLLFEYENNYISLERLHRLYNGLKSSKGCADALFVGGDLPLQNLTVDAVNWARGKCRLEVLSLVDLYGNLDNKFP
jgi:hypothetical protein